MEIELNGTKYHITWSYKKRKHGRVKTICTIFKPIGTVVGQEGSTKLRTEYEEVISSWSQNNVDEGDGFNKKEGRKRSFLKALNYLLPEWQANKDEYRKVKKEIFTQLEATGQLKIII